ncbi:MAG: acyl-CoA dehydrogenase family protein, partial [Motiliproteus sp.]
MTHKESSWMNDELRMFRDAARSFFNAEFVPHRERWAKQGMIDREAWIKAGEMGLLFPSLPEQYGGVGGDFAFEAVVTEEQCRAGFSDFGSTVHSIAAGYILAFGSEEQKHYYLPKVVSGEMVVAVAMTEPCAGSDLQGIRTTAVREGDEYVINGSKTFITNGHHSDIIVVVAKTDKTLGAKGISLIIVEKAKVTGLDVGKPLDKLGKKCADTTELFFDNVRVPVANLLGDEPGQGFYQLMKELPRERMFIGVAGVAVMEKAIELTVDYVKERKAFGKPLLALQNTRFKLAEAKTEATIARVFVDNCIDRVIDGTLDVETACMAKWWVSQKQCEIVDECLQLHGGYGYMMEYPIAQMYADSRVAKIYGGANE